MTLVIPLVVPDRGLSGSYGDRTAIPLPQGLLRSTARLRLLENGRPAPAQFGVLQRWPDGSIRWASLDFTIRIDMGEPRAYTVDDGSPAVEMEETDRAVTVDTGAARFEISKRYAGLVNPDESLGGPYLADREGQVYRPGIDSTLEIVSAGPICAEMVCRGEYVHERGGGWNNYVVRIRAHAGSTSLDIEHQTILTQDTRGRPIADVGYAVPVSAPQHWYAGIDGQVSTAFGRKAYVHQYRHDRVRMVVDEDPAKIQEAKRSDGWLAVRQNNGTIATVVLRDVWQRFPKELEFHVGKLVVHAWPKHGIETFPKEERLHPDNVWRLLYAHHGQLLDLGMPEELASTLDAMNAVRRWDAETGTVARARAATCTGVSVTARFSLDVRRFQPDVVEAIQKRALVWIAEPHAVPDPEWLDSTRAARFWDDASPAGSSLTKGADALLHEKLPSWIEQWRDHAAEYGMWVFANFHTTTDPWQTPTMEDDKPDLHRLFQNSHYSQASLPFLLHARKPDARMLRIARDCVRTWMDIGTTPDGQSRHCKSFVPWCNQKNVAVHYLDADTGLVAAILDRDSRGRDFHDAWFRRLQAERPTVAQGRETVNTLAHVLTYYDAYGDPRALEYIRRAVDTLVSEPWQAWREKPAWGPSGSTFVMWHVRWLDRAFQATGDLRLVQRAREFIAANPAHAGLSTAMFLHEVEGDNSYLTAALPRYRDWLKLPIDNAGYWRQFRDVLNFAAKLRRAGVGEG